MAERIIRYAPGALALLLTVAAVPAAHAVEIVVKNDSLTDGGLGSVQAGFAIGEWAAAWLTMPTDGTIVAFQIGWYSPFGGQPDQIEQQIQLWQAGAHPTPGSVLATLTAPLLTDGVINEYRFLDVLLTEPINIPVTAGQEVVLGLQFAIDNPGLGPGVVTDTDGCQNGKNSVFCVAGCVGWNDPCPAPIMFSGDFMIRVVLETGGAATGACCFTNPDGCSVLSAANCATAAGAYAGDGTDCADLDLNGQADVCQPPPGACCFFDPAGCSDLVETDCDTAGGSWLGAGTSCATDACPEPPAACCLANGSCIEVPQSNCEAIPGAVWAGFGTTCPGACLDCAADCDDGTLTGTPDGQVSVSDLLGVLGGWGQSLCDVDDGSGTGTPDGQVNVSDLLYVLARWGPC